MEIFRGVVRGDLDLSGGEVLYRLVAAAVAEFHFERIGTEGFADQLWPRPCEPFAGSEARRLSDTIAHKKFFPKLVGRTDAS